jgi:hypothetical protein
MHYESLPTTEQYEYDQTLWSDLLLDQPVRSDVDWFRLRQRLGHVALEPSVIPVNGVTLRPPYLRGNDYLSADDVRELEDYFSFLRSQYGIPEGASVFPKRAPATAEPDGPQEDGGQEDHNAA